MNTLFVTFLEEESKAVVGFDPSIQGFLEIGEEPRLDSFEL